MRPAVAGCCLGMSIPGQLSRPVTVAGIAGKNRKGGPAPAAASRGV